MTELQNTNEPIIPVYIMKASIIYEPFVNAQEFYRLLGLKEPEYLNCLPQ